MAIIRILASVLLLLSLTHCSSVRFKRFLNSVKEIFRANTPYIVTTEEVEMGLKEALTQGVNRGIGSISKINGYLGNPKIKIPFPDEFKQVEEKLRKKGFGAQVNKFIAAINHSAEKAVMLHAKPIFIDAIQNMTIEYPWNILKDSSAAATEYLREKYFLQLKQQLVPVIQNMLAKEKVGNYYASMINSYNKISLSEKINTDFHLDEYVINGIMKGLFFAIAQEEMRIRTNIRARGTWLLDRVFGDGGR